MSFTHAPSGPDFSMQYFSGDVQKDSASRMELIAEMNNKGAESMERGSDFANAAAFFCGSLNLALTASEIPFIRPKAFSNVHSGKRGNSKVKGGDEYDEGMGSLSEPVKISPLNKSMALSASTILFNVGVLNLRRHEDMESFYCFSQALNVANQQGDFPVATDDKRKGGVDIVTILYNIGFALYRRGSYEDSIRTYANLLSILRESKNPSCCSMLHVATTLNCLGVVHYHVSESDPKISLDFCVESLATRRAVIGHDVDDKAVATTLNNIGRIHFLKGELSEAIEMYKYSLNMRRRLFGNNHDDVAATICNIGQAHHRQGNPVEAMNFYKEFVMIAKDSLGFVHRYVAVLKFMAQTHAKRGDHEKATFLYGEAISVGKATLGPSEEIASILNHLGGLFHKKGDFDVAISIYMEGLRVERQVFHEAHPNIAVTLSNIGSTFMSCRAYQPALCFYGEALVIQRQVFGNSHPKIASSLSCIATIHFRNQSYADALDVYQEVLSILHDTHGEDHIEVASTLNSIGLAFSKMNLPDLALEYLEKSLRIRRALLGNHHHSLATILFNIGAIYTELGQEKDADTYYHKALCVERHNVQKGRKVSKSHLAVLQHVALKHQQRGDFGEAIKYLSEKVEMLTMSGDELDSSAVAVALSGIGCLYLQTGQTADMVAVMSKALRYIRQTGNNGFDLDLSGFGLYCISKCHPECAAVA